MKNFIQPANLIDIIAPAGGVVSGVGVRLLSLFGVATKTEAAGEVVSIVVEGVVEIAKLSTDNMAVGNKVCWDNTNKRVQLATSDLDDVGTVVEAAAAATTKVKIKLTPV